MSPTQKRASLLAAAIACLGGPAYAQMGSVDSAWYDSVPSFVRFPESPPLELQTDAGLLVYPSDPVIATTLPEPPADKGLLVYPSDPGISVAPSGPEVVYVPYDVPYVVTNDVYVASHRYPARMPTYSLHAGAPSNGGPSLARQMQLRSQVVTRGNGGPSPALQMQRQQRTTPQVAPRSDRKRTF